MIRYFVLGLVLSSAMIATQIYFKDEIANTSIFELENSASLQSEDTLSSRSNPASGAQAGISSPAANDTGNLTSAANPQADNLVQTSPATIQTGSHSFESNEFSNELWVSDDSDRPVPEQYQRNGLIPEPLKFNRQQVKKLNIGDRTSLSIPQTGQAYDMKIRRVVKHENGTRTLTAEITNTPVPYSVVVTEGKFTTFATVNTPEGTYSLDAKDDEAWLVAQLDLDQLIDPNLLDYQIPDMHR